MRVFTGYGIIGKFRIIMLNQLKLKLHWLNHMNTRAKNCLLNVFSFHIHRPSLHTFCFPFSFLLNHYLNRRWLLGYRGFHNKNQVFFKNLVSFQCSHDQLNPNENKVKGSECGCFLSWLTSFQLNSLSRGLFEEDMHTNPHTHTHKTETNTIYTLPAIRDVSAALRWPPPCKAGSSPDWTLFHHMRQSLCQKIEDAKM